MTTFTWTATYATTVETTPRVLKNEFGAGYTQRAGDGINTMLKKWAVEVIGDVSTIDAVEDFLEARGGWDDFDWTPPRAAASSKYICPTWSREFYGDDVDKMIMSFEEVADL